MLTGPTERNPLVGVLLERQARWCYQHRLVIFMRSARNKSCSCIHLDTDLWYTDKDTFNIHFHWFEAAVQIDLSGVGIRCWDSKTLINNSKFLLLTLACNYCKGLLRRGKLWAKGGRDTVKGPAYKCVPRQEPKKAWLMVTQGSFYRWREAD